MISRLRCLVRDSVLSLFRTSQNFESNFLSSIRERSLSLCTLLRAIGPNTSPKNIFRLPPRPGMLQESKARYALRTPIWVEFVPCLAWLLSTQEVPYENSGACPEHRSMVGARAASKVIKKRLRVQIPGVRCSETKILDEVFSSFPRWTSGFGSWFSHCTRGPTISLQCTSSKQMKVGEEIRVHKFLWFTRTRELTWNHSGCRAWNRPTGEGQAGKKARCQLAR